MASEAVHLVAPHVFYSDEHLTAGFTRAPITPYHAVVDLLDTTLFRARETSSFIGIMLKVRRLSIVLSAVSNARRCALVFDGATRISLIPLHGLGEKWKPVTHETVEYHATFPGFITSKNGPKLSDADLDATREIITAVSGLTEPLSLTFLGPKSDQNLFARIIRGELPSWKVWEDVSNVAFLTPFANTPGYTVLVPRKHLSSDIFLLGKQDYSNMLCAAHTCMKILTQTFNVSQCGFIFEGFEIDYAHIKLIPIHKSPTDDDSSSQISNHADFQMLYSGYVTSQPGPLLGDLRFILDATNAMREALKHDGPI